MKQMVILSLASVKGGGSIALSLLCLLFFFSALVLFIFFWQRERKLRAKLALLEEKQGELELYKAKMAEFDKLIPDLLKIGHLDHDINTPLCVITMSLGRAKMIGEATSDSSLLQNVEDIVEAVKDIGVIMQQVRVLKTSPIIPYGKKKALREEG